jgi:hypothetical protein
MKLRFGFICDDVRREDNGKLLFIGTYGSQILVPSFPATIVVALVASWEVTETVDVAASFQVLLKGNKIQGGSGRLRASGSGNHFFPLKNLLIEAQEAGDLDFQIRLGDGDWQSACVQPIAIKAST